MPKNVKIPKKIAGVKLPKKARKAANKAIEMGGSPVVRELAAAAIGAATGKAGKGERKREREAETLRVHGSSQVHIEMSEIGEVLREAALDGLRRFIEGFEEGLRDLSDRAKAEGSEGKPGAATGRPGPGAARG